jgi:Tfp pilus assembly protein PilO
MNLNKFKNLNIKTKVQYTIILYIAFISLIAYFYIIPTIDNIKTIKADIFTEKVEQEKKLNRERNYATLGSKLKEIEPQLGMLEKIYINANRKLEFITTLEGAAMKSGIEQKLNLDLKFNSDGTVKKVPIIIDATGTYEGVISYLTTIETLPYYININSINLNMLSAPDENSSIRYNLHATANTYWK